MRIVQVNAVNKVGSTGRTTWELHQALLNHGIDSFVAATHMNDVPEGCYQIGNSFDWKRHALLSRITGFQGHFSKKSTKEFIGFLDGISPDIVHLRNIHANYLDFSMLMSYLAEKKIATVITLHDCYFYTGKCTHYTLDKCEKWKNGCYDCPKLKTDIPSWFFDRTRQMWIEKKRLIEGIHPLAVVGVSDWLTGEAKKSLLSCADEVLRIYNWINIDNFKYSGDAEVNSIKKSLGIEEKFVILGVASDWNNRKGLNVILDLSEKLNDDECIVIVGNVPETTFPSNVKHIDNTGDIMQLSRYYSMADVFLQLSLEETFGKVVAEAESCGTPVITNSLTANPELVNDKCGYVLPEVTVDAILNCKNEIRKKGRKYYSDNCRKFAEQNFDMRRCIEEYLELYCRLIQKK